MSDFLDNLAERAMSVGHSVRPSLPSLFDPAPSAVTWSAMDLVAREPLEVTTEREADIPHGRSAEPFRNSQQPSQLEQHSFLPAIRHQNLLHIPPERPSHVAGFRGSNTVSEPSSVETPAAQTMSPLAQASQESLPVSRQHVEPFDEERSTVTSRQPVRPLLTGINESREAMTSPTETRLRHNRDPKSEQQPIVATPRLQKQPLVSADDSPSEPDTIKVLETDSSGLFFVRPNLDLYDEPLPSRRQPQVRVSSDPPIEQVINVTIGRIEVRATPAPPAAKQVNHQKTEGASLDEYLLRRSGKGAKGGGS